MRRAQLLEEFERTRHFHRGKVEVAAPMLGMKPEALARALYRARKDGIPVSFSQSPKVRRFT